MDTVQAILLVVLALLSGPAVASASTDVPVSFTTGVTVHTDGAWQHWRAWNVESATALDRSERCRYRFDASRVLRGKPVTQGVPKRCLSKWERTLQPDPASR